MDSRERISDVIAAYLNKSRGVGKYLDPTNERLELLETPRQVEIPLFNTVKEPTEKEMVIAEDVNRLIDPKFEAPLDVKKRYFEGVNERLKKASLNVDEPYLDSNRKKAVVQYNEAPPFIASGMGTYFNPSSGKIQIRHHAGSKAQRDFSSIMESAELYETIKDSYPKQKQIELEKKLIDRYTEWVKKHGEKI